MICDFKKIIEQYSMLSPGDKVVVGLSGGADSMTLLNLLNEIKEDYSLDIVACHVNHKLRSSEADRDMDFVKNECRKLGIRLETLVVDVKQESQKTHESVEECGRRIRYGFFNEVCGGGKIATAHNLCDNEETVILNLLRGTGIAGLKGIPHVRGNIIRPLLDFSREQIEKYCSDNGISYVHDSSNDSDEYKRNFVRHNILPKMKELEPSFDRSFQNFAVLVARDNDFIEKQAKELIHDCMLGDNLYDTQKILNSHPAVASRALSVMIYDYCRVHPEKKHVDILLEALNDASKKVQITAGVFAVIKKRKMYFVKDISSSEDIEQMIEQNGEYFFFDKKIILEDLSQKVYSILSIDCVDCDKIVGDLVLRNRREGDRISLQGRNVSKTLKKLFCEDSIAEHERYMIPVIADDLGVVWVKGYGCDNRCKAEKNSKNIVLIKCETVKTNNGGF